MTMGLKVMTGFMDAIIALLIVILVALIAYGLATHQLRLW